MQETWLWSLGLEDPLEKGMAPHPRIPWMKGSCRLPDTVHAVAKIRHDRATATQNWSRAEWKQVTGSLACSPSFEVSWFLIWGNGRGVPGVRPEGWLRCFAHFFGGSKCWGGHSPLLLLLTCCFCFQLFRGGIWVFDLFVFCYPQFVPTAHTHMQTHTPLSLVLYLLLFSHSVASDSLQPVDCSITHFPVFHHLLEFAQTLVHYGEGNGKPLPYSCLENPMGKGAWQATVYGVSKNCTWLSDCHSLIHSCPLSQWSIQPSHPLSPTSPPALNLSQHQGLSNESGLHIRWPTYWSFSFSISPSNIQGCFPLGLTGLICLLSKEVSLYFFGQGDICQLQALLPRVWGLSLSQFYKISLCSNLLSI